MQNIRNIIARTLLLCLSALAVNGFTQPSPTYYASATNLSGKALFDALNQIISNHNQQSYNSLWTHFQLTDKKPNGKVWDMYSDIPAANPPYQFTFVSDQCGNYNGEGDCYNREHSWPKSWCNDTYPAYSDLFHLYPTDGYVNSKRSNFPFGEVDAPSWTSQNGSKLGPNSFPGYTGVVFEPIDEYKGDFARSYFYMSTRYAKQDASWTTNNGMTTKSVLKPWAVQLLYAWHLSDTVSQKEIDRNNAIYSIQGNRNPYIDYPVWVRAIWGDDAGITASASFPEPILFPNPATEECRLIFSGAFTQQFVVQMTNLQGQQIPLEVKSAENGYILSTAGVKAGMYLLNVCCLENGQHFHKKLTILSQP